MVEIFRQNQLHGGASQAFLQTIILGAGCSRSGWRSHRKHQEQITPGLSNTNTDLELLEAVKKTKFLLTTNPSEPREDGNKSEQRSLSHPPRVGTRLETE